MPAKWDQSTFDRTLEDYFKVTQRTAKQVVDTKAFYVSRKATWFTMKADTYKMKQQLGGIVTVARMNKKGKMVKRRELQLVKSSRIDAPLAALIINARRGRAGEPGLQGPAMARAIRELLSARARSIAFLKSGWLPAIRKLAPLADRGGAPAMDTAAKQIGRPKGDATPAQSNWNPRAEIINLATTRRDTKGALVKYASDGLRMAIADEEASMREYIERKMKPDADRFNAAQK